MSIFKTLISFLLFALIIFAQATVLTMIFSLTSCIAFTLCDILILVRIIESAKSNISIGQEFDFSTNMYLIFLTLSIAILFLY